ncbi:TonB-dependent receptor [Caulobacter sp. AP07]|uniref:TonB-dependent receptor n=1 Tax=Caulobacter sp. AP07 TaxID=1144304 RepID=UPI0002FDCDFC|nr:TonB-dependent receptor [Caulobacter sp. AP07]
MAQAPATYEVAIPAQPLPQALARFSLQTKIQVVYAAEAPYGRKAPAVRGRFSQGEILSRLLAGSGLTWREVRPGVVTLDAAPAAERGAVVTDALQVEGAVGGDAVQTARDALGYDGVYDVDGASTYAGRETVERYKGVSPADVLKGMVNVYSGDARNSGALDPNVRGVEGPGRVPVIIDGGEQALTVWRGYNGANNRSYIDPSLIGGLQVLKGPSLTGGVHSSTGGAVIISTLRPDDILREGQRYGAEVRVEGGNNSVKPRLPTLLTGQDYRNVPGFPGSPGVVGFPSSPYDDPYVQVTPKTASDNDTLSLGDRSARMAVAGRTDAIEWLAAYAWRERGNYYAGETEADFYSQTNLPTPSGPQDLLKRLAFNYKPGNEAPNTSSEMSSWLGKLVWKISDRQALELGVRDSVTTYGEVMPSRIISTTSNGMGKVQWPLSEVHATAYNLDYRLWPQGRWIDLKTTLWLTRTNSHAYNAGGFPNWAQNAANPILKDTALANAKNDRYGLSASNKMRLAPQLDLVLAGDWQHEKLSSPDVWNGTFDGWRQYPRAGRREEYNLHANFEWRPTAEITLAAGARYSHYWAFDDFLAEQIDKGIVFTNYVFTDAEVIYRTLVNGRTVNNTIPWPRDSEGRYTRATDPCVNGFLTSVANATGYCSAIINQAPVTATSATKRGDDWAPVASATFNFTSNARAYVRYAEAYRFPSMFESTIGFSASTPAKPLKPEHARTWEIAYVHDLSSLLSLPDGQRADVKLTYFHNRTRNVIERSTQLVLSNLDKQIIEGLELQARYDNGRLFADLSASHSFKNKACDAQAAILKAPMTGVVPDCVNYGFVGGYLLTQATPKDSVYLNLGGRFLQRRLEVGLRGAYYSAYDNPELERFIGGPRASRVDGYASNTPYIWGEIVTVDAYANFKLNDKIRFELTGTNLNDRYYTDPLTRTAQPAPGRTLKLSMTARY